MNRRFEFRLARLRRVREIDEQVARAVWTAAEAESHEATMLLEEAREAVHEAEQSLSHTLTPAAGGRLDPQHILHSLESIRSMLDGVRKRRESALTLRSQADQLAEAWQEREVERRALSELEDRARARHRTELEHLENAATDEGNLMREARRRRRSESDSSDEGRNADTPRVSTGPLPFE